MTATYLEYSDRDHAYYADGRKMQSVTQILDAAGHISSYCKDEEARYRGTMIHELTCEEDTRREPLDLRSIDPAYRGYIRAWRSFKKSVGFVPQLIEQRVDCPDYGYAGRFDRLGSRSGKTLLTMLDIKTSKTGLVPEYARLQLAAYCYAFNSNRVFERMAVSLMPTGKFTIKVYPVTGLMHDRAEWLRTVEQVRKNISDGEASPTVPESAFRF